MTHDGTRRRNKNYGDSPVRRSAVPIASSVLESCSPIADARSWKTACISNTRHSLEAPLRVKSGVLASPAKCVPRDPAPAVPRVVDATFHRCERGYRASSLKRRRCERRYRASSLKKGAASVFGVAGKKLVQYVAERCSRVQLGKDGQPA
jgi:hypothetical protein